MVHRQAEIIFHYKLTTANDIAGIVFDEYSGTDFKFAALDLAGQKVIIGHWSPRGGWTIDTSVARALTMNTDYQLQLSLKGASVAVTLNGAYVTTFAYYGATADGKFGLLSRNGTVSVDSFRVRTNDAAFAAVALTAGAAPLSSAGVPALTSGQLDPVIAAAKAQWLAWRPGADFKGVTVSVGDLPGLELGQTLRSQVTIDATAAGWGWNAVDATGSAPHMDLLAVVTHELGHVLGFEHGDAAGDGVMAALLFPSQRSRPPALPAPALDDTASRPPTTLGYARPASRVVVPGVTISSWAANERSFVVSPPPAALGVPRAVDLRAGAIARQPFEVSHALPLSRDVATRHANVGLHSIVLLRRTVARALATLNGRLHNRALFMPLSATESHRHSSAIRGGFIRSVLGLRLSPFGWWMMRDPRGSWTL